MKPPTWFAQLLLGMAVLPTGAAHNANEDDVIAPLSQILEGCLAIRGIHEGQIAARLSDPRFGPLLGSSILPVGLDRAAALVQACRHLTGSPDDLPGAAAAGGAEGEAVSGALKRRLMPDWLVDQDSYYIMFVLIAGLVILVLVVFYEGVVLNTTFLGARCKRRVKEAEHAVESRVAHLVDSDPKVAVAEGGGAASLEKTERKPWNQVEEFWTAVKQQMDLKLKQAPRSASASEVDKVGFVQRDFAVLEASSKSTVTLERMGSCKGVVVVRAVTVEAEGTGSFQAVSNHDYAQTDVQVRFEDGQKESSFDIQLLPTDGTWLPTRWFGVQLKEVVSGQAELGGPSLAKWDDMPKCPTARVCIVQDDRFPGGLPEEKLKSSEAEFWVCYYYIKERIKARGKKFWKTMAGYCYEPWHSVVVTPLIQSYILDWAAKPGEGGTYRDIVILAAVQLFSSLLLRYGDYMQVANRGRTGGARQVHRRQLLSKLLMMDHEQQYRSPGLRWLYAGVHNVDSMVVDCYWQVMVMAQCVEALVLCLLVLLWKSWYKRFAAGDSLHLENFFPALVLLLIIPLAFTLVWRRRKVTAEYLEHRMQGEESWVEIFAWLAQNGRRIYSLGARELARVETMFTERSSAFLKKHGLARDYTNDSKWLTKWLCNSAYCLMLCWGAFKLLDARLGEGDKDFSSGDCLILIQVFDKFGKYMVKLEGSIISMQKAAVSIRRVSELLSLPEQKRLVDELKQAADGAAGAAAISGDQVALTEKLSEDHIILKDVQLNIPPTMDGFGPLSSLKAKTAGKETCLPLGKVIYIKGGSENQRLTFLTLLTQLITPVEGKVWVPKSEWSILLPADAIQLPDCTVKEDFLLTGANEDIACKLAQILGLDPDECHIRLPPGKSAMQALGRSLLRDPTVLVAVRPMSTASPDLRDKIMHLLLAWQLSGGARMLTSLLQGDAGSMLESEDGKDGFGERRTLIISGESAPDYIPQERLHIFDLDSDYERATS